MRVVLTGGGTGAYLPAVAIARQCEKEDPKTEFYISEVRGVSKASLYPRRSAV